tara:strand:- start:300 stop:707 length:408 start_codon:yes stop_codon:yes gene_type:complete
MAPAMDQAQPAPRIQPYHFELLPYHFELLPYHFELLPCRVERSVVIDVHLQFFDRDCVLRVRMTGEDADSDEVFSDCKQITRQPLGVPRKEGLFFPGYPLTGVKEWLVRILPQKARQPLDDGDGSCSESFVEAVC